MQDQTISYFQGRITINPDVCNGRPTIRGKQIAVQTILEFLSTGETREEILHHYPSLKPQDIDCCLQFAAKLMDQKYVIKSVAQDGKISYRC